VNLHQLAACLCPWASQHLLLLLHAQVATKSDTSQVAACPSQAACEMDYLRLALPLLLLV
jgi:hypothetical protein